MSAAMDVDAYGSPRFDHKKAHQTEYPEGCNVDGCPVCEGEHILYEGLSDRELLERVLVELKEVRREHNETVAKVNAFLEGLAPHLEQIAPMIDALAQNPMFRMLAGGGKKKEKQ